MSIDERRLASMLARHGLELRRLVPLPGDGHAATWRLDLSHRARAKLRIYPSGDSAARVHACLLASTHGLLPRPMALDGRRLVVEFIDGTTLDRCLARGTARQSARWAAATGRLLARLHASPRPDVPFSPIGLYSRMIEQTLHRLIRRGLLDAETARILLSAPPPSVMPVAITHGDACPENLVVDRRGRLRAIDEERVAVRAVAYDLARAICRWPLEEGRERVFLRSYRQAGGRAGLFEERRTFWLASALTTSAGHRLRHRPRALGAVIRRLRDLAHGQGGQS